MNNNDLTEGNPEEIQRGQSLIGLAPIEVVSAVEGMLPGDASFRWQEMPEINRATIWAELDLNHKNRLFNCLSNECRLPLWDMVDAANKFHLFSGSSEADKTSLWGSLPAESKEALWNDLNVSQKGALLYQVPSDDMIAVWRQWPDGLRSQVLEEVNEPALAYFYRALPVDLRPAPHHFTDYLNRCWSASNDRSWASQTLKSPEDLRIISRGLVETSRNALWDVLGKENKLSLFEQLSPIERNGIWQGLSSSSRDEFWNSLESTEKIKLLGLLSISDRNTFWQTISQDQRSVALWENADLIGRVRLLLALSQADRDAMWGGLTPDEQQQLWAAADVNEEGQGWQVQNRTFQAKLADALSPNHRLELWNHLDPNAKAKLFQILLGNDRDALWQMLSLDQRNDLWNHLDLNAKVGLLGNLSANDRSAFWQTLSPGQCDALWDGADMNSRISLLMALSQADRDVMWARRTFEERNDLWIAAGDLVNGEQYYLTCTLSLDHRLELWNRLDPNAKLILLQYSSENDRNALWQAISLDQREALWRSIDTSRRISLLVELSQTNLHAMWERWTPAEHYQLWTAGSTDADSQVLRTLINALSHNHRSEFFSQLDPEEKVTLCRQLTKNNKNVFWRTLSPDQRNEIWDNIDFPEKVRLFCELSAENRSSSWQVLSPAQRTEIWDNINSAEKVRLFCALSADNRNLLWQMLSPEQCKALWHDVETSSRILLLVELSQADRDVMWARLTSEEQNNLWITAEFENQSTLTTALSPDHRLELWNNLDPNRKVKLLGHLSVNDRNAFWQTLPLHEREALWEGADMSTRISLLVALSQADRDAIWELLTPEERYHLWTTAPAPNSDFFYLGGNDQIGLLSALSPNHLNAFWEGLEEHERLEHWNRRRPDVRVDFFVSLSQTNRDALWQRGAENFNLAGSFLAERDQIRLLAALSENDREPLWQGLGAQGQSTLFRRLARDERQTLRTFLPGDQYDALVEAAATPIRDVVESLLTHPEIAAGIGNKRDDLLNTLEHIANDAKAEVRRCKEKVADVLDDHERDNFMHNLERLEMDAQAAVRNCNLGMEEEPIGDFAGDEPHVEDRRQKREALAAAKQKHQIIVDLQKARLNDEHIRDFAFVCEREAAALLGKEDPATGQFFGPSLPSPEKDKKQMPQILLGFAYKEETRERLQLQAGQGTMGCVDNLIHAISEFHKIHMTEEAKSYNDTYLLLDAIIEKHGWDVIDKLTRLRVASLEIPHGEDAPVESVEHAGAIQVQVGRELKMLTVLEGMMHAAIGGTEEDFDRYRGIARMLRADSGRGNIAEADRLATPLVDAAKGRQGPRFGPPRFVDLIDFVMNDEIWGKQWKAHIKGEYRQKFEQTSNPALKKTLHRADETRTAMLEAHDTLNEAKDQQRSVTVPGIHYPVTLENIDALLDEVKRTYDAEEEAAAESIYATLTNESVAAYLQIQKALQTHTGPEWRLLPAGNPAVDREMQWGKLTPAVQLQLEMVRQRKPEVREIVIGPEYGDADMPRIWVAANLLDLKVQEMDNRHLLLKASHHKAVADGLALRRKALPENNAERDQLNLKIAEQERLHGKKRRSELPAKLEEEIKLVRELLNQLNFPFKPECVSKDMRKQERWLIKPWLKDLNAYSSELSRMQQAAQSAADLKDDEVLRIENYITNQKARSFPENVTDGLDVFTAARESELRKRVQLEHIAVNAMTKELNSQQPMAEMVLLGNKTVELTRELSEHSQRLNAMKSALRQSTSHAQLHDIETYLTVQEQKFPSQLQAIKLAIRSLDPNALGQRQVRIMQSLANVQRLLADQRQYIQTQLPMLRGDHPDRIALDQALEHVQGDFGEKQTQTLAQPLDAETLTLIEESLRNYHIQQRESYVPEINRLGDKQRMATALTRARTALDAQLTSLNELTLNKPDFHQQYENTRGAWRARLLEIDHKLQLVPNATAEDLTRMQDLVDAEETLHRGRANFLQRLRSLVRWFGSGPSSGGDDHPGPGGGPPPSGSGGGGPGGQSSDRGAEPRKSESGFVARFLRSFKMKRGNGEKDAEESALERAINVACLVESHLSLDEVAEIEECGARLVAPNDKLDGATQVLCNGAAFLVQLAAPDRHSQPGQGTSFVVVPAELYNAVGRIDRRGNDAAHEKVTAESILSTINKGGPFHVQAKTWENALLKNNGLAKQSAFSGGKRKPVKI